MIAHQVNTGEHEEWTTKFYLSEARAFRSVVELVSWSDCYHRYHR